MSNDKIEEIERLTRERDEARAEVQPLRAERDTLLLDARDFVRWFNRHYTDPSRDPDHPWCALNDRLNAHADTLAALDAAMAKAENARLRAQVAEYFRDPATHPMEREE